ncbi:MAG TPA: hypothetical protein VMQ76_12710 [Terracidiphilus sp.]|nr:hypothetical protein [Terracidiphilus sp.]
MNSIVELFQTFGPLAAIAIIFVWQTVVRERRMSDRLDAVDDEMRTVLIECINRNTVALHEFSMTVNAKRCSLGESNSIG